MSTKNAYFEKAPSEIKSRQFERIRQWASEQDHERLAVHFAGLAMIARGNRVTLRKMQAVFDQLADHAENLEDDVQELFADLRRDSEARRRGGAARWSKDPKQEAKASALELWKERDAGKHPKLRTVEQFATEVMRRWPVLTSAKTIAGWSAAWSKDAKESKSPAC